MVEDRKKHHKNRKKYHKNKEKHYKEDRKKQKEEVKKEPINESAKESETEKLYQYNRQMEERRIEANRLKQCKRKKLKLSNAHHRKAARDYAVSSDNTLREITGAMPNIELKHPSSNETIYTDDQLM